MKCMYYTKILIVDTCNYNKLIKLNKKNKTNTIKFYRSYIYCLDDNNNNNNNNKFI